MSGLMSVTGEGGGRPPVKVGSPCTDIMCGTLGALGISGTQSNQFKSLKSTTAPDARAETLSYKRPESSTCISAPLPRSVFAQTGGLCCRVAGALRAREITGLGQLLDTSLYEAGIMLTYWQTAIYLGIYY